jgi:hypothetical protein
MHTAEMKKCGFIKNKVVEHIVKASIEKATLIPHTNVTHGIDDSNELRQAWMIQNQQHLNMTYKVPLLFTKYAYCTCEWVLRGNLCKRQIAILFTCIDLTKEIIIQYCGTWYGFDMEVLPPCLWMLPICTFMTMNLMMKITMNNHGLLICVGL